MSAKKNKLNNIKGILLDLEGVLYTGEKLINGAVKTIKYLKQQNLMIRYLTNTTTTSQRLILSKLRKFHIPACKSDIFSPSIAANMYLKEKNIKKIYLLSNKLLREDFADFKVDEKNAKAVILGDIYKEFNWEKLNKAFQIIIENNAIIIALHKNKYCRREKKIALDLGPFVESLEYASNKRAIIMGKPEKNFFSLALKDMNLPINQVVMVGDDILSDIGGAKKNNIIAIQVKTGKFQKKDVTTSPNQPDFRINSIADLPNYINS